MPRLRNRSSSRSGGHARCAAPARGTVETLERRTLLSVAPAALTDQELWDGIARHTLTPEQMAALDFVEIEWQGRPTYQKAGEWILGFEHEAPTFDERGNLVDLNIEFAGPATPVAPEVQQRFDQLGLGIRFDEYLGVTHQMVIDVPRDVTFERLNETLQRLPDFAYVEPNAASFVPVGGSPNSPGIPVVPPGGAVAVRVNRGVLSIRGDGSANAVTIVVGSAPGEFVVSGAAGTTVNGQAGPVTLAGVTRGLRAKLGAGDDRLSVTAPALPGDVSVDLGRGTDALALDGAAVGGNLAVRGGAGSKTLDFQRVRVAGRTALATGADADAVNFVDSTFVRRATIRTGGGDDALRGTAVFAAGRSINDGPGEDSVSIIDAV